VLRQQGGIGPDGTLGIELGPGHFLPAHPGGISVVNLRADHDALLASGTLDREDAELLADIRETLEHAALPNTTLSVTSPLALLNELFTVKGSGTLIKLGSTIHRYSDYAPVDLGRLKELLESSFKRTLSEAFFDAPITSIYLEEGYRGAAIVQPGHQGAYLTKFAVDPLAQGEGIGQDLWRAMHRDTPRLYWRARRTNPILPWYQTVCDGFVHQGEWSIFWRGYQPGEIEALVRDALAHPVDLVS
jgi:acetylglutamate kinase